MPIQLIVRDATIGGNTSHELLLELPQETMTVRELIRERIYQEVQDHNRQPNAGNFQGLIQPSGIEPASAWHGRELNPKARKQIDWKESFEKALASFNHQGFLILINNRQAESLDETFEVGSETQISFVKLIMLTGG